MTNTLTAACEALAAGFSLLPIKTDGSKAPAIPTWKHLQQQPPTDAQLQQWFGGRTPHGLGLIHGAVSGHSEALDFDEPGLYAQFAHLCTAQGWGDLVERLPLVETPSGGHHLLYRCEEPVAGNTKLAETPDRQTRIETRGEGGYTVAPGSPAACHAAGLPYQFTRGSLSAVPILTPAERFALHDLARVFHEYADLRHLAPEPRPTPHAGTRPGDDFNTRGDYAALLETHGWQQVGSQGDKTLWQRPGKTGRGLSATSNHASSGLLYVFSANAAPFEPQRAYSPFAVYTLLEHGGDFPAAARALSTQGYGTPAPERTPALLPPPLSPPAPPPPRQKPLADRIVDLADVQAPGELPLLFGQYLLKGHAHWLTGQTGLGKSTVLFNLTTALAEGRSLWGIDCPPTRILYVDMESGDVGRAHKIERLYQGAPRVRGQLFFLREPVKLPEELPELLAYVGAKGIGLVVFDTARRCFSVRDENDNAEVYNRVIPILDALKQRGVASLTLGHPSKNGNGSARGAGAQEDAGDVNLSLTMHRGEINDSDGVIALRVTKNRLLGLGVPPLYLRRVGDDQFERAEAGDGVPLPEPASKRDLCKAALLDYLETRPQGHASHGEIIAALKQQGHSEATARRAKDALVLDGDLLRAATGGYCLPDHFA